MTTVDAIPWISLCVFIALFEDDDGEDDNNDSEVEGELESGSDEDEAELVMGGKLIDVLEFPTIQNLCAKFSAVPSSVGHPLCAQEIISCSNSTALVWLQ